MSDFKRCKICGEYGWLDTHKCQQAWDAVTSDYDPKYEDVERVYAGSGKEAAEKCLGEHHSDWDYPEELEMWVRKVGETKWEKYMVTVEPVPEFTATPIKEDNGSKA